MKNNILLKIGIAIFGLMLVVGCASKGDSLIKSKQTGESMSMKNKPSDDSSISNLDEKMSSDTSSVGMESVSVGMESVSNEQPIEYSDTVVYFAFDSSQRTGETEETLLVEANALLANDQLTVVLTGHTDKRGSPEYNLALGERRAQSVRDFLMANGIAFDRIEVVSYGEERPAKLGNTEASYAKNRRVELMYSRR